MTEDISVNWIKKQIGEIKKLWQTKRYLTFCLVILVYSAILISFLVNVFYIPSLKTKIEELEKGNSILETRLIPFKTVALEKFSGQSENQALSALAERIGQVELSVISLFDYQEVSTWRFLGVSVKKVGGTEMVGDSPALNWSDNYVKINNVGVITNLDCSVKAVKHYLDIIQRFELYPFPYYVLALCQQKNKQPEWEATMGKAYKILSVTTRIPGHDPDHDAVLRWITVPR
jgi:hypothetical protein